LYSLIVKGNILRFTSDILECIHWDIQVRDPISLLPVFVEPHHTMLLSVIFFVWSVARLSWPHTSYLTEWKHVLDKSVKCYFSKQITTFTIVTLNNYIHILKYSALNAKTVHSYWYRYVNVVERKIVICLCLH